MKIKSADSSLLESNGVTCKYGMREGSVRQDASGNRESQADEILHLLGQSFLSSLDTPGAACVLNKGPLSRALQ